MNEQKENLMGALTGAATAALASYIRNEDDLERRLRNTRDDAEEALDLIRDLQSRGEVIRSRLPAVNDAQVGISIASQQQSAPAVIPSSAPSTRPDLSSTMDGAVADLTWPPHPGVYTDRGLVQQAGELTASFLALTYEEVRAFILGLTQPRSPSRDAKVQIFNMATELSVVVSSLRLTHAQYRDAWTRLFTGQALPVPQNPPPQQPGPVVDVHRDPNRPPVIAAFDAGVTSVTPLGKPDIPAYPYEHRNIDVSMKLRIVVGAGPGVAAGSNVVSINFGSEFRTPDNKPVQPAVLVNDLRFYATSITSTGFVLSNWSLLAQGTYDVLIGSISF
ncbi:MAG: hypothetical protein U1A78_19065 [Polyangia bacterium]